MVHIKITTMVSIDELADEYQAPTHQKDGNSPDKMPLLCSATTESTLTEFCIDPAVFITAVCEILNHHWEIAPILYTRFVQLCPVGILPDYGLTLFNDRSRDFELPHLIADITERMINEAPELMNYAFGIIIELDPEPLDGGKSFRELATETEFDWLQ